MNRFKGFEMIFELYQSNTNHSIHELIHIVMNNQEENPRTQMNRFSTPMNRITELENKF